MKIILKIIFLNLLIINSGCEVLYDVAKSQGSINCGMYKDYYEYQRCMRNNATTYNDYKKQKDKEQARREREKNEVSIQKPPVSEER
jgi:hypothetical protein